VNELDRLKSDLAEINVIYAHIRRRIDAMEPDHNELDREVIRDMVRHGVRMAGSQNKLAKQLGVSPSFISTILSRKRVGNSIVTLLREYIDHQKEPV
jgi:DNA invertase Pin-like site-specific DNA recombinase